MKFLVDANLPISLSKWLYEKGYESHHTSELETGNKTNDKILISLSMQNEWTVITKYNDFLQRFFLMTEPKKLIKKAKHIDRYLFLSSKNLVCYKSIIHPN